VVDCDQVAPTSLSPGQVAYQDASREACVRLPGAPSAGAEYLYLALSAASEETKEGTSAEYLLTGSAGGAPPAAAAAPRARMEQVATPVERFHARLRALGQKLAREGGAGANARTAPSVRGEPPVVGEKRTFNVLRSTGVDGSRSEHYVQVAGTAQYVGTHVAIFTDDDPPSGGGYTPADIATIGSLFDDQLYPIDVNAFGQETDINGDGVVLVLLTDHVTRLAGCVGGQIVVGLFFAVDLLPNRVGSNKGEVFYGLMPDPGCGVTRARAVELLPAVFIHEFEHMINYGQHVIMRKGKAENTWLDEGLAQFAEELGARLVPDDRCANNDCTTQFQFGNFDNAYRYLSQIGESYLIGPRQPPLPLTQYGAAWLFVRWLADHFADDPILGTDLTRRLVQTTRTGADNVVAVAETPFDVLDADWQMANYLDDHPDFGELARGARFEYTSWNFRDVFAELHQQNPAKFSRIYPLEPDRFAGPSYSRAGVLHAGSAQHVVVEQSEPGVISDLLLTRPDGANALPSDVVPRSVVLRLR
jgi:hypothetical protein